MAYYHEGLTDKQLAERFHTEAPDLNDVQLAARFGTPRHPSRDHELAPYSFLEPDPFSPDALRTYNQLPAPDWIDQHGREYTRFDNQNRQLFYIRLPKSITIKQRREGVSALTQLDFPRPGEEIDLTRTNRKQSSNKRSRISEKEEETIHVRAIGMTRQLMGSGLVQFAEELPQILEEDPEPDQQQQQPRRRLESQIQHREEKLEEEARQQGLPPGTLTYYARASRGGRSRPPSSSYRAPRAPAAPKR